MAAILDGASLFCTTLLVTGILARLCPEDKTVAFVQSLLVLTLLASGLSAVLTARWDFDLPQARAESTRSDLSDFLDTRYQAAAEEEAGRYIRGLLGAAGLEAKKCSVMIPGLEESGIVCTKVSVVFTWDSDARRARTLLENVLGDEVILEVTTDDG